MTVYLTNTVISHCLWISRRKKFNMLYAKKTTTRSLNHASPFHCFLLMIRIRKILGFVRTFFSVTSPFRILPSWRLKKWQATRWRRYARGCPARLSTIIRWHSTPALSRICFSVDVATSVIRRTTRCGTLYHCTVTTCQMCNFCVNCHFQTLGHLCSDK